MTKPNDPKNDGPALPEKEAVKLLRKRFNERRSGIRPSPEMDEIVKNEPAKKEESTRKIAKPARDPDLDLP